MKTTMKKKPIQIDPINSKIVVSKAFYNKASNYGTNEYRELHTAMNENPTYGIEFKTIEKRTFKELTFERMEAYIKTQPNSEQRFIEFEAAKTIADTKGAKYPLTKKWFLKTYPEYRENEIKTDALEKVKAEIEALIAEEVA